MFDFSNYRYALLEFKNEELKLRVLNMTMVTMNPYNNSEEVYLTSDCSYFRYQKNRNQISC